MIRQSYQPAEPHRGTAFSVGRLAIAALLVTAAAACSPKQATPDESGSVDAGTPEATAPDPDTRTAIMLSAPERHAVLGEMRIMLASVQGYIIAASQGDTAGMRSAAHASGMAIAVDSDPGMEHSLPAEFMRLGMGTHMAWDSLALAVSHGASMEQSLVQLGEVMKNCVACHVQYRISLKR